MQLGAAALLVALAGNLVIAPLDVKYPITTGFAVFVLVVLLLQVIAIVGSLRGWRWTFWAVAVYFAFVAQSAVANLPVIFTARPSASPLAFRLVEEALAVVVAAFLIWMLIAVRKFGPWAMQKPRGIA